MKISIVGVSGVLGRHVLPRLLERGHEVTAIVRKKDQAERLERLGVHAFIGDILVQQSLPAALNECECVLHLATAIPKDLVGGDWTLNDRIRREGTQNLLHAAKEHGVRRYLQQSIILLYGDCEQQIVGESAQLRPSPYIQSAFDMEQYVRGSNLDWCILRGGNFYGPSTGTEEAWREQARSLQLRIPENSDARISLVHVVDMARAIVIAIEHASPGSIYNVVDDEPSTYKDLFTFVARQIGSPDPKTDGSRMASLSCTNRLIKSELGWQPVFSSYRSGLV